MMVTTLSTPPLEHFVHLPVAQALQAAVAFLTELVQEPRFVARQIRPLLAHQPPAPEPVVAQELLGPDQTYALRVFVWPPGAATDVHAHAGWGAVACVVGQLLEERYRPGDDLAPPQLAWRRLWRAGDGVSTFLPEAAGMHRILNPRAQPAISVHLYGPPLDPPTHEEPRHAPRPA